VDVGRFRTFLIRSLTSGLAYFFLPFGFFNRSERVTGFDVGIVKHAPSAGASVIFGNSAANDSIVNVSRVCPLGGIRSCLLRGAMFSPFGTVGPLYRRFRRL
jgi:hypothetical protein